MNKLTPKQLKELIQHMNRFDADSFKKHAEWATRQFGVFISSQECSKLFMQSVFN